MKRLKQTEGDRRSKIYKFLIENDGEVEIAIGGVMVEETMGLDNDIRGNDDRPERYPYVILIAPDDEYRRIDLAFVSPEDLLGEGPGGLKELENELYGVKAMQPWVDRITEAARNGESEVEFQDLDDEPNFTNERALNNKQSDYISSLGYDVKWEKYMRTWTVSGWL